jgi:hypothetical protein
LSVADTPEIANTASTANAVINNPNLAERIAFYHASMFSPALSTWCTAIDAGHFTSWPELTSAQVRRYPPPSIAMVKGHLDQERASVRSTKLTAEKHEITTSHPVPDPTPESLAPDPAALKTHFLYADCQPATGQIYTDPTGRFLVPSVSGNSYILVVYNYNSNFIHAEPMKNCTKEVILAAYQRVISLLKSRWLQPKLQKLENEASQVLQQYMVEEHINFQLVPPGLHRRNAAERAIRTFKNHFIAGLCTTAADFPLTLWDQLLPQALMTFYLLRTSRINPRLSAWSQVHGIFDFNRTPLAPPGTRVLVHEKPSLRGTWSPHAVDGLYLGPAMLHYRCYRVWIIETTSEDTVVWLRQKFPSQTLLPPMPPLQRRET